MPAIRCQTYGVTIGDYFYVFGGAINTSNGTASNSVYRYNRITDVWDSPTTMPYAARELTANILPNGFIHIAGGTQAVGSLYQSLSYWYDPYNNTWTAKNNLPFAWMDGRVGFLPDGRTIIFGGSKNNSTARITDTYIYDPDLDSYTATGSMVVATGNHVAATMANGKTISTGGDAAAVTQTFDPSTMAWSRVSDYTQPHGGYPGIAATPCGIVYLWGGRVGTTNVSSYDPASDTWSILSDIPFAASHGAYGRFYDGQYIWASGNNTDKTYLSTDPVGD
jgi:N-acetylneuraminic acid mutarotase